MTNFYGEIKKIFIINGSYKVEYVCGTVRIYESIRPFIADFMRTHSAKMYGSMKVYR